MSNEINTSGSSSRYCEESYPADVMLPGALFGAALGTAAGMAFVSPAAPAAPFLLLGSGLLGGLGGGLLAGAAHENMCE